MSTKFFITIITLTAFMSCGFKKTDESNNQNLPSETPQPKSNGELIFHLNWKEFFKQKYDTSQLRCLVPTDFSIIENKLILPNKILDRIDIFDLNGKLFRSLNFKGHDIDAAKIQLNNGMDTLYILDPTRGLYIVGSRGLIYHDEKTIDFFTSDDGDIYFENSLNRYDYESKRAYIDKKGILREPLIADYTSAHADDKILTGLKIIGKTYDDPFVFEKYDLLNKQIVYRSQPDTVCTNCFMFPKFLSRDILVATNDKIGKDQLYNLSEEGKMRFKMDAPLPEKFVPLKCAEYFGQSYSGLCYEYDIATGYLYIMGSDKEGIRVFRYKL